MRDFYVGETCLVVEDPPDYGGFSVGTVVKVVGKLPLWDFPCEVENVFGHRRYQKRCHLASLEDPLTEEDVM